MKKQFLCLGSVLLSALLPTVTFAHIQNHCDGSVVNLISNSQESFHVTEYVVDGDSELIPPQNLSLKTGDQLTFTAKAAYALEGGLSGHITLESDDDLSTVTLYYSFKSSFWGQGQCHAHVKWTRSDTATVAVKEFSGDGVPATISYTLVDITNH